MMEPTLSEEELWSWVDRSAPELDAYVQAHPEEEQRVKEMRHAIRGLRDAGDLGERPLRVAGFHVLGLIGRGGMGCVYDAEQQSPRRRVALKSLVSELAHDERRLELFRREGNALARMLHPGIAVIYEVGCGEDGRPYIAMERIEGRALDRYLAENVLDDSARLDLAIRICEAMAHAHAQGVVHRDLKAPNILVDERGHPKIVDFGLAIIEDEQRTRSLMHTEAGALFGTLRTMSPEQVLGHNNEVGPASDVYALGVLLHWMLTGRYPYDIDGLSLPEAARRIAESPPRRRRGWRRLLRGDLATIVYRTLEKAPKDRYCDAGALVEDLRRHRNGDAIQARPRATLVRAWRAYRRHWIGLTALASLAATAVLLFLPWRIPIPIGGSWMVEGSPFEAVRWQHNTPEVQVRNTWYELIAIDDLRAGYVLGYAQQNSEEQWRKRFSEDLMQVLHRMGNWSLFDVDLELRNLETGELVHLDDVRLSQNHRRRVYRDRHAWPWQLLDRRDRTSVFFQDQRWKLVSCDGLPIERFSLRMTFYDAYCEAFEHSPGPTVTLVLRDEQGTEHTFENVLRDEEAR